MTRKAKYSLLAAGVMSAVMGSQAQAGFTYDLRFAPGQNVAGATFVDAHNVNITQSGGVYTLQLWGQISGDTTFTNDGWGTSFVNAIVNTQIGGGAFTSGGINAASLSLGSHVASAAAGAIPGVGGVDANGDAIADWGNTLSSSTVKANWMKWSGGGNPGYIGGTADAESEQVNANTWEVLLGTLTVTPGSLTGGGTTAFTPFETPQVKLSGTSTVSATIVYVDSLSTATNTVSGNIPVNFTVQGVITPEPASIGVLALGGVALLARRRKQA